MEKYELVRDIGSGNFGVARLMRNKETKELVAMKYIERGHKVDENVAREIINHKSLRHPNIIRFKEVVLTPTHLAIVMEYAVGGELFERICNAGRCNEDEARYFFQQLISGVSYCHFLQICHRHLKLENMLLDGSPAPRLKICDFGYRSHLFCTRGQNRRWGRRRISHRRCFLGENMTGSSKLEGRSPSCRLSDKASDLLQRWFEDDDVLERALSGELQDGRKSSFWMEMDCDA